nr:L-idonate 5-dehydrogenase [uncultured Cohaesibacter sp.]
MQSVVLKEPNMLAIEERAMPSPGAGQVRVRVKFGSICGSDIHYLQHGGFGTVRMKAPMILGHELSGVIDALGEGVEGLKVGDAVAVNPSQPCGKCKYCLEGRERMCTDMHFMGSAMRTPHEDGGFREFLVCSADNAVPVGSADSLKLAALSEPLSVCLHAVSQAPDLKGKRVLISGFGPIGALVLLAARYSGAESVAVADMAAGPLALAETLKAAQIYDVSDPHAMDAEKEDRGQFDVVFECAGHPSSMAQALEVTKLGGTIVQVGMTPGDVSLPINTLITKEISLVGTFRFDAEFEKAAQLISSGAIDVSDVISHTFGFRDAEEAFSCAMDRSKSVKVLLNFD